MVEPDYILAPQVVTISFGVEPVFNALESMSLLLQVNSLSGLSDWVAQTAATLPAERMQTHRVVFEGLGFCVFDLMLFYAGENDFLKFVDKLASIDPVELQRGHFEHWHRYAQEKLDPAADAIPSLEQLLNDRETFVNLITRLKPSHAEPDLLAKTHALAQNPVKMLDTMVSHLRWMWNEVLAAEWERELPLVEESVAAYQKLEFNDMTLLEAIRAITGRDFTGKLDKGFDQVEHVTFVPSTHIGPYITKIAKDRNAWLSFGARQPRGAQTLSSALNRSELLVRLNALSDDTRLRILELLTRYDELCAQDIIERLGVSQSSVSRHLSQLSATGYITERRREVSKCYSLNTDRVVDTVRALTNFLARQ